MVIGAVVIGAAAHVPAAYVAALAAAGGVLVVVTGAALAARRAVRRRLASLALRLTDDPGAVEGARTEALFALVERGGDRALDAAHASRAAASRLAAALDSVPEAVVVADESGRVVFRNARASATGTPADAVVEHAMEEVLGRALDDRRASGSGIARTIEVLGPPARAYSLRASAVDDGRRTTGAAVVAEDISAQRAWDRKRRGFFTDASRQLRAPAAAMAVLAEMVSEEAATGSDAMVRQLSARLQREAGRAIGLVDLLAELAGSEREQSPIREVVDLRAVVEAALAAVKERAEGHDLALEVALGAEGAGVAADHHHLATAVQALIGSVVELAPCGTPVGVDLAAAGGELVLAVTGDAITGAEAAVLEPFTGSAGLGLAVARSVAAAHGGGLAVERRSDGRAALVLRLPAVGSASCRYGLGAA